MVSIAISIPNSELNVLKKILLRILRQEILKDSQGRGTLPKGLIDSFSVRLGPHKNLILESSWEGWEIYTQGKDPFRLKWLLSKPGFPLVVPMQDKKTGELVYRTAPLHLTDAWVHPGIAKHNFLVRTITRFREEAFEYLDSLVSEKVRDVVAKSIQQEFSRG